MWQILCIGETKRPFDVGIEEHRIETIREETEKSGTADHPAKTIRREPHWKKRKLKVVTLFQLTFYRY